MKKIQTGFENEAIGAIQIRGWYDFFKYSQISDDSIRTLKLVFWQPTAKLPKTPWVMSVTEVIEKY